MLTISLALLVAGVTATPTGAALLSRPLPPAPFFGLGAEHGNISPEKRSSELDRQAATGVTTMRENLRWDQLERSPGKYDFSTLDSIVRGMAARNIQLLPTILYAPDFATDRPAGARPNIQYPPKNPASMAALATKLVKRYGPSGTIWCARIGLTAALGLSEKNCIKPYLPVTTWQVWNEPNFPSWWGGKPDAAAYAQLLTAVSAAIHKADPETRVMAAGLTNKAMNSGYLDQLYDNGAGKAADVMALHPYGGSVSGVLDLVRRMRLTMVHHGDVDKPLALTEYGWADGGAHSDFIVKTKCQAALVYAATRRFSDLRSELGLDSIYDFYWNDQPAGRSKAWPLYAGMVKTNGTAKPVLAAFTAAVNDQPPPAGLTLPAVCPRDRQSTT